MIKRYKKKKLKIAKKNYSYRLRIILTKKYYSCNLLRCKFEKILTFINQLEIYKNSAFYFEINVTKMINKFKKKRLKIAKKNYSCRLHTILTKKYYSCNLLRYKLEKIHKHNLLTDTKFPKNAFLRDQYTTNQFKEKNQKKKKEREKKLKNHATLNKLSKKENYIRRLCTKFKKRILIYNNTAVINYEREIQKKIYIS